MSNTTPQPETGQVKDDPGKPYKAIAAAVVAGVGAAIAGGQDILPAWVMLLLVVLAAGLGTYVVPNPKV